MEGNPVSYLDPFGLWKKTAEEINDWVSSYLSYVSATVSVVKWLFAATGNLAAFTVFNTLDKILSSVELVTDLVDIALMVLNHEEISSIFKRVVTVLSVEIVDGFFGKEITAAITGGKDISTLTKVEKVAHSMYISTYDLLYQGLSTAVQYLIENVR